MQYFKLLIIGLFFCRALPAIAQVPAGSLRLVLPLEISYDNKMVTPFVDVTVNNKVFKAIFDTGSGGLRMMSGALGTQTPDSSNHRVSYAYGEQQHSLSLRGNVIRAQVSFGKMAAASAMVSIMSIDSARFGPRGAWMATGDSAILNTNHFRNCPAMLGVGLRSALRPGAVVSPLRQMPGNGKFIVLFPSYGASKGTVIINPAPADEAGFVFFQLSAGKADVSIPGHGWLDNRLPGCISINGATECLPTLLDTGNPDIQVLSTEFSENRAVPSRNYITMQIGDPTDSVTIKTGFTVSDQRVRGKDIIDLDVTKKEPKMIFGTRFFFEFDVLYDAQNGIIGIRKKNGRNKA